MYTYDEYLALLEVSGVKLEYCDGEIDAMAGGTPVHADLGASITRLLGNAVVGRCRVSSSDLKIRIEATDLSTFPDAAVVCGERRVSIKDKNAVINPTLLVEVTSPSTEDYDRGEKLSHYKQCPSLQVVLFVSHRRPQVTIVERTHDGWQQREARASEMVELPKIGARFAVDELYAGIGSKADDGSSDSDARLTRSLEACRLFVALLRLTPGLQPLHARRSLPEKKVRQPAAELVRPIQ